MVRIITAICVCLCIGANSHRLLAQFGTGLLVDDSAYAEVPILPDYGKKSTGVDTIYKVNLAPYCPEVKNQGSTSSCTGWATGYGAFTIQRAIMNGWYGQQDLINEEAYSAYFLYNQIKQGPGCEKGSFIEDALDTLKTMGNTLSKRFDKKGCNVQPGKAEIEFAKDHKIEEHRRLFEKVAGNKRKIRRIKESLLDNKPVIICMRLKENFTNLYDAKFWLPRSDASLESGMAHAMVVVGYDDNMAKGGAFQIMNSWGSEWGKDGFIWVDYEGFAEQCCGAYHMSIQATESIARTYTGSAWLRIPEIDGRQVTWNTIPAERESTHFSMDAHDWRIGTKYQMLLGDMPSDMYVYAFSIDHQGKINVHWPRDSKLDAKFEGKHESAFISGRNVEILVPGENRVLILEESGTESLICLFSTQPIDDINEKLNLLLGTNSSEIEERFYSVFVEELLPEDKIKWRVDGEKVNFSYTGKEQGMVPIFMKMEVDQE